MSNNRLSFPPPLPIQFWLLVGYSLLAVTAGAESLYELVGIKNEIINILAYPSMGLLVLFFHFSVPPLVFWGAYEVWGWEWYWALLFAAPVGPVFYLLLNGFLPMYFRMKEAKKRLDMWRGDG